MSADATSVRARRAGLTAALALAVAVTGLPAAAADRPAATRAVGSVAWGACADATLTAAGLQCATVQVPLDYAKPTGATIPIAISRIPASATGADYLGPLVSNPGGPGVAGLAEPRFYSQAFSAEVAGRYDLIGMDPRGTGESGPELRCDPAYFAAPAPDLVPPDPARIRGSERRQLDRAAAYVKACRTNSGAALEHQRTLDAARDLDRVRAALGAAKLSFFGSSYGTYLGQVFATTFPKRVGRMVLTGVVPPDGAGYDGDITRPIVARAYERNIDAFFAWVATYRAAYNLGDDAAAVRARYFADQDELRAHPREAVGPAEWNGLFAVAVYAEQIWPTLAQGWSTWTAGRPGIFDTVFAPGDATEADDFNAAYLSVACSDGLWPRSYRKLRADSLRNAREAPFIAWAFHWEVSVLCSHWPVTGRQVEVGNADAPPMLLVNATFDAPTPYPDSLATRAAFPGTALIEVAGALGHGARSLFGNPCAQAATERYLLTGELPARTTGDAPDLRCDRLPAPGYLEIAVAAAAEALLALNPLLESLGVEPPVAALPASLSDPERLPAFLTDLRRAVAAARASHAP